MLKILTPDIFNCFCWRGRKNRLKKNGIADADGYSEAWQQQVLKNFAKN
jgi:hypothetical protein